MRKYILFESKHNQIERVKAKDYIQDCDCLFPCLYKYIYCIGLVTEIHWLKEEKINWKVLLERLFVKENIFPWWFFYIRVEIVLCISIKHIFVVVEGVLIFYLCVKLINPAYSINPGSLSLWKVISCLLVHTKIMMLSSSESLHPLMSGELVCLCHQNVVSALPEIYLFVHSDLWNSIFSLFKFRLFLI